MRQNKIQNERTNEKTNQRKLVNPTKKEWYWHVAQFGVGCLLLFFAVNVPVFAAGNVDTSQITGGFDAIYQGDRSDCICDRFHLSVMGTVRVGTVIEYTGWWGTVHCI